jgi:hypothetical protein
MTIKNFRIEEGLDLNGLVLTNGDGELLVNGDAITVDLTGYATESYVDALAQGLDVKASVKVATTTSLVEGGGPLGGGTNPWITTPGVEDPTIDGVTLSIGDRVLVKDNYDGFNGIHEVVSNVAGYYMLERTADGIIDDTLTKGAFVFVEGGTSAGKGFVANIYPAMPPMMDYVSVFWSQFSEAGSYISSVDSTLNVSGGQLSVNKGYGISVDQATGELYSTLVDQQILRDQDKNIRVWKQTYYGTYDAGTNTASVSFSGATQWGEVTLRYGQRISKIMFAFDQWTEYGIVDYDNNMPSATVDFSYSGGQFHITVSNAEFSGNLLAVVEFLGN